MLPTLLVSNKESNLGSSMVFLASVLLIGVLYWEADELLRKIQLEGLTLGFGAGIIFMGGYRLLEQVGAPEIDTSTPLIVMMVFWSIGQILGVRRYS